VASDDNLFLDALPSGIRVVGQVTPRRRTAAIVFRWFFGTRDEPAGGEGLTHLAEASVFKGTSGKSAREMSDAFDALGARRSSATGVEHVDFGASFLPDHTDRVLALYAEAFGEAAFPAEGCRAVKQIALQELKAIEDEPSAKLFSLLWLRALGPKLGRDELGTAKSVAAATRSGIAAWWRRNVRPGRLLVSIVGDFPRERTLARVEELFGRIGRGGSFGRPASLAT
jgi:predicted Zn-dependent peptidase